MHMTQSPHGKQRTSGDGPQIPPCFRQGVIMDFQDMSLGEEEDLMNTFFSFKMGNELSLAWTLQNTETLELLGSSITKTESLVLFYPVVCCDISWEKNRKNPPNKNTNYNTKIQIDISSHDAGKYPTLYLPLKVNVRIISVLQNTNPLFLQNINQIKYDFMRFFQLTLAIY